MAFLPPDQRELFLPLIEGIHESTPWQTFMRNLVARTYARRGLLVIRLANAMPSQAPTVLQFAAPRAAEEPPLDTQLLGKLRLHPYGQLRPDRVYALEEMLDFLGVCLGDMEVRVGRARRALVPLLLNTVPTSPVASISA